MVCQHTTIEALEAPYVQFEPSIVLSVPRPLVIDADAGELCWLAYFSGLGVRRRAEVV